MLENPVVYAATEAWTLFLPRLRAHLGTSLSQLSSLLIRVGFTLHLFIECKLTCALYTAVAPNILNFDLLGSSFQLPKCVAELCCSQNTRLEYDEEGKLKWETEPCFSISNLLIGSLSLCPSKEVRYSIKSWDCPLKDWRGRHWIVKHSHLVQFLLVGSVALFLSLPERMKKRLCKMPWFHLNIP